MLLALALLPPMLAGPALAQLVSPFRGSSGAGLTKNDVAMVMQASGAVNTAGSGAPQPWTNPGSGNSGTVSLSRSYSSNGRQCHALHYTFAFAKPARRSAYDLNWCQTAAGDWKIAN